MKTTKNETLADFALTLVHYVVDKLSERHSLAMARVSDDEELEIAEMLVPDEIEPFVARIATTWKTNK